MSKMIPLTISTMCLTRCVFMYGMWCMIVKYRKFQMIYQVSSFWSILRTDIAVRVGSKLISFHFIFVIEYGPT